MGKRVLQEISKEIKFARYFSLIIQSIPDASHADQFTVALLYVSVRKACANERLVRGLSGVFHKAQDMEAAALNLLEELKLDLKNYGGQSYDNASSMPGVYSDLQTRIREKNVFAKWNVLRDYVRRSNEHTQKLKIEHRFLMLKSLSRTRWSARADVLRAQVTSRNEIKNALEDLIEDNTQIPDTRVIAEGFRKTLESFQTTLLTMIWDEILQRG
ncbi:DUF4371 domain-containing protein [Trichonephila clavata]|uniref:DUF4371 domain-containing protein n=1 Tax=Trichonephila clavata TaxID=2740835 RepID=A0A8X6IWV0_TRICU|nr:DUF4371 domain-containing protein [Trichonephila clavata]